MADVTGSAGSQARSDGGRWRRISAVVPFALLVPVLRQVPLPPAGATPLPWSHAILHSGVLLLLMAAHAWCYRRWQLAAPRRILLNEFLTRLWFATFAVLIVQGHAENGWALSFVAVPWAALTWEVHRQEVRSRGYDVAWNVTNLGLFLVGLWLMAMMALRL